MIFLFLYSVIFIILKVVHSEEQIIQRGIHQIIAFKERNLYIHLDKHISSSLCTINRQGFGQLERVELTSYSINIQFKNIFYNLKCSSIHIYAFITNTHTNKLERTIEVH